MAEFVFQFLGTYQVSADAVQVTNFHSDKVRALLAYLILEPREHSRIVLAALLWPDISEQSARSNLRVTLHRLRQTLDAVAPGSSDSLLAISRQSISFNSARVSVDVHDFLDTLRSLGKPADGQPISSAGNLDQLEVVTALYRGELLAGFGVSDAPAFEEWLLFQRELLHQQAQMAFRKLLDAYKDAGRYDQAYTTASHLLFLDPFSEETHRQIMQLWALMGQPDRALQQLERLREFLRNELNVEPAAETVALVRQITGGKFGKSQGDPADHTPARQPELPSTQQHLTAAAAPMTVSSPLSLSEVPNPGAFFGREQERRQIERWLVEDGCKVVAILGLGGMGKTTLAAQSIRELVGRYEDLFDAVYWRSLVNAPPLSELLPPLLQALSQQQLTQPPENLDEQLRLLLTYLSERRVLIVLDNLESILEPGPNGAYRPGYESYGQLIQRLATFEHQSHLVLTSRERPRGYDRLERDGFPVKALPLIGLDNEAGNQLFLQRGLLGDGDQVAKLIKRYSGNPLALKLVTDTVDELFGGNIAEFLADDTLIFDDIRTVLDEHFSRLSDLEQQVLFWLAIERETTPLAVLRGNLLTPPQQRAFLETLRNLQHHLLVERHDDGFALQNVITEYLTDRLVHDVVAELQQGDLNLVHRYALLKAQAKEYVRQSQARLLLLPIANQLKGRFGSDRLRPHFKQLLDRLRLDEQNPASYAGGNLFNLLVQLDFELADFDFSHLHLRYAHLQGVSLWNVNLAWSDLADSTFTQTFGEVPSTAISPDGRLLASGAESGDITLWQLNDYQPIMTFKGHTSNVSELAFSPDGKRLASSSIDATVRIWDIETGQTIGVIEGDQQLVFSVAYSPDGRLLASGGVGQFINLWDANTAQLMCRLEGQPEIVVRTVAFHPDGTLVGAADRSGHIFLWHIGDLYQAEVYPADADVVRSVIRAEDGEQFIALGFSHDGTQFATGDDRGQVKLWDTQTRQLRRTFRGHQHSVRCVAFSPDDSRLVSTSFDRTARLWDIEQKRSDAILPHQGVVWSATFSPDGKTLVTSGADSSIRIWNVHSAQQTELVTILHGYRCIIPAAAFSPTESLLALGDSLGTIRLWDISQDKPRHIHTLLHQDWIETLAFSPNGRVLAAAGGIHDHAICLWDMTTKQTLAKISGHSRRVRSIMFTPEGNRLASAAEDGTIRLWDVRNSSDCRAIYILREHQNTVFNLSFNADGSRFVSSSDDRTLRIWDTATGGEIRRIAGLGGNEIVAFSPAADILVCSAGDKGDIRLLDLSDVAAEKQMLTLSGHRHEPVSVSFSPDGSRLVSGSSDSSVRIWDIERGRQIALLDKHRAYVKFVKYSPTGRHVISTSSDGVAYLWDAETGACLHTFYASHPYDGLDITGVTGISEAQRAALMALGAVDTRTAQMVDLA